MLQIDRPRRECRLTCAPRVIRIVGSAILRAVHLRCSGNDSMIASQAAARNIKADPALDFDAVIIGAGVSGLYQLYRLRELGLKVRAFEAGTGVGGSCDWNRYPRSRLDSERWTYEY